MSWNSIGIPTAAGSSLRRATRYVLQMIDWDITSSRTEARAAVTDQGFLRPFWGWNRAKHAVLEATILATRLHLTPPAAILEEIAKLSVAVEKTAGARERQAWELVQSFVASNQRGD